MPRSPLKIIGGGCLGAILGLVLGAVISLAIASAGFDADFKAASSKVDEARAKREAAEKPVCFRRGIEKRSACRSRERRG